MVPAILLVEAFLQGINVSMQITPLQMSHLKYYSFFGTSHTALLNQQFIFNVRMHSLQSFSTSLKFATMDSTKDKLSVTDNPIEDGQIEEKEADDNGLPSRYRGTAVDKRDMIVLGKKQVLRVSAVAISTHFTPN
jgi:hypothetical protein